MKYEIKIYYGLKTETIKYHVVNQRGHDVAICFSKSMASRVAKGLRIEWENRERCKHFKL